MVRCIKIPLIICLALYGVALNIAVAQRDTIYFRVGMEKRENHTFDVSMRTSIDSDQAFIDFRMPVWSPGYYQLMDFPAQIADFTATDARGNALQWEKVAQDSWRIHAGASNEIVVNYAVQASRSFVGTSYIDATRAFMKPASLFMYLDRQLNKPVRLTLIPPAEWPDVATGLAAIPADSLTFTAPDFDTLYDSPLLVGKLRHLPPFYVNGIEHRFIGYGMVEDFDEIAVMNDIKKIVESSAALIGDIPYRDYTFIGLGPGQGGIEQLNSTAISFTGQGMDGGARLGTLSFIAHEYFHHYNVKRIRPIELGPFDYSRPNRTNLLWVAEGLTVYYENVVLNRAELMTGQEILDDWTGIINRHENNEGRFKQTLAESSWNTWEDGPFGTPGETISYYVKGPIIGMLLDIEIRHATKNKKSLDDVMRKLYHTYYKAANSGFNEEEMKRTCEEIAGKSLDDIFKYIYTVEEIDYPQYFEKAGLHIHFTDEKGEKGILRKSTITMNKHPDTLQKEIRDSLFGGW